MKIYQALISAGLFAASSALFAQEAVVLLNNADINCRDHTLENGNIYTFTHKKADGVIMLVIHGDITAQLVHNPDKKLALEHGANGDNGAPFQFHEIAEDGDYTLTIEKGGQGAVCLSAAG